MSYVDKLLGIAGMSSTIAHVSMLKRFLSGVTVVIALTAVSSTMAGMILIVALYALYLSLVHHGLDQQTAVLTVTGLAVIATGALAALAVFRWRQLRNMPHLMPSSPVLGHVSKLADAFVAGLLAERRRNR